MKLYTVFTESHMELFQNYFIKSLPFDPRLELRVLFKEQLCNAEFRTKGWRETMYYKVRCFIQAAKETTDGEYFIFSDPDIQFFRPFYDDIMKQVEGYDAAFQNDYGGGVNTGFFIMKSTSKTRAFLNTVEGNLENFPEEQVCFNHLISNFSNPDYNKITFKTKMLSENYWTYGANYAAWDGNSKFTLPKDIVMHHGNWTKSFAEKKQLLNIVREKFNEFGKF